MQQLLNAQQNHEKISVQNTHSAYIYTYTFIIAS